MSSTVYFKLVGVVILASGLVAIAVPDVYSELLGMEPSDAARLWTRAFAVTALGLGIVSWAIARTDDVRVRRALAVALAITFGLNTAFGVIESANGVMNVLGWGFVVFDILIVAGALYVLQDLRTASPETGASG